jgi:hypothetical protein
MLKNHFFSFCVLKLTLLNDYFFLDNFHGVPFFSLFVFNLIQNYRIVYEVLNIYIYVRITSKTVPKAPAPSTLRIEKLSTLTSRPCSRDHKVWVRLFMSSCSRVFPSIIYFSSWPSSSFS